MEDAKPLSIPMSPGHNLTKSQQPMNEHDIEEMRNIPYREAIGSLMYVVVGTWPNIAYAVSYLAHFMANPGRAYWEAMKRIIRYLKGTKDAKLTLGKGGCWSGRSLIEEINSELRGTVMQTEIHRNTDTPSQDTVSSASMVALSLGTHASKPLSPCWQLNWNM